MSDDRLDALRDALIERRDDAAMRLIAEIASGTSIEPHAMISNANGTTGVTEAIASMYDAIVGSLDWGSEFLDTEQIEHIVLIGKLMGFELPSGWERQLEAARRLEARQAEQAKARAAIEPLAQRERRDPDEWE